MRLYPPIRPGRRNGCKPIGAGPKRVQRPAEHSFFERALPKPVRGIASYFKFYLRHYGSEACHLDFVEKVGSGKRYAVKFCTFDFGRPSDKVTERWLGARARLNHSRLMKRTGAPCLPQVR
jgi:hypothetical protein